MRKSDLISVSLESVTKSKIELSPEEINFLASLRGDVETLLSKLEGLRSISFFSLRDVEKIEDEIEKLKVDLGLLEKLNSPETTSVVDPINGKLQELIDRVGELKGKINKHKRQIEKSIVDNQKSINDFLVLCTSSVQNQLGIFYLFLYAPFLAVSCVVSVNFQTTHPPTTRTG